MTYQGMGRTAKRFAEGAAEMRNIRKPMFQRHLRDAAGAALQQRLAAGGQTDAPDRTHRRLPVAGKRTGDGPW